MRQGIRHALGSTRLNSTVLWDLGGGTAGSDRRLIQETDLGLFDGAAGRVGATETSWAYHDAKWASVFAGVDPDPANAAKVRDWCVSYHEALHPDSMGGSYIKFMMNEGQERIRATYGQNYDRLVDVKTRYDPENLFRVNQNIKPVS